MSTTILSNIDVTVLKDGEITKHDLTFKIIVIGDSGVGKSCLSLKAVKNTFESNYSTTVGFEYFIYNVLINQEVTMKLQIWDTCGQEIYRSLISSFYKNSSLAILVYSIDRYNPYNFSVESFHNIDIWLKELKLHSNPDIKLFLIGNKADLEKFG